MRKRNFLILMVCVFLSACGGGGSSSGGGQEANRAVAGVYDGEFVITFSAAGISTEPQSNPLQITVAGQGATQQAIIVFSQFSGSSSVGPNLDFFIPSGSFRLGFGDGEFCQGTVNFSGVFTVSAPAVNGTVTGTFRCPGIPDALAVEGTFNATLTR